MDLEFVLLLLCALCVSAVSVHERALDMPDERDTQDLSMMDLKMRGAHPSEVSCIR